MAGIPRNGVVLYASVEGTNQKLKKERDAVILAHFYVDGSVQEIADYVGDSYYLSKKHLKVHVKTILFCGVEFMGKVQKF